MGVDRRDKPKRSARDSYQTKNNDDADEYRDVIDDVRRLWTSWMASSNTSDNWRRIESSGLENSLKMLSRIKSELFILASLSVDEARQLSVLMTELKQLLTRIRLTFIDNEKEIFDGDEAEKRYLTSTCSNILEVWSAYCTFSIETATRLTQKLWQDSANHKALLRSVIDVCAASVKLIVLTTNLGGYHSLQEAGSLQGAARQETEGACSNQEKLVSCIADMKDEETNNTSSLQEISQWNLYGIWHLFDKLIKLDIDTRAPDAVLTDYEDLMNATESMLQKLKDARGENTQEPEPAPVKEPVLEKKNSKSKGKTTIQEPPVSTVQNPEETEEKKEMTKDRCLDIIQKVGDEYDKVSEEACSNNGLATSQWGSGVQIMYRMEMYSQIGKLTVRPCPMMQRKEVLDSLALSDSHKLFSDLYVVSPEPLSCTQEVTFQFPVHGVAPMDDSYTLCLKLKRDGKWENIEDPEQIMIDGTPYLVIKTTACEAFTAVTYTPPDTCVLTPEGAKYNSKSSPKVKIQFPEGCVEEEVTVNVKLLEFDKGVYEKEFVGIMGGSVGVELIPEKQVEMKKRYTIQLPMIHDIDDKDTELVLARCQGDKVQILDKKQICLKQQEPDVYSFEMMGFWSVAILRIRRVFVNMRESVKKEFQIGYSLSRLCSILTYIDHLSRDEERQAFVMEVVQKCDADSTADSKRSDGLIEVKSSRSKDVLLSRGDQVTVVTDGQIRSTEQLTDNHNVLCYMLSASNIIHVATEIKRDPERMPDAMIVYKRYPDNAESSAIHTVSIMTRDLSELPTEEIAARHVAISNVNDAGRRNKKLEEAAIKILHIESLMSLAREMTFEDCKRLGCQMGVKPEVINYIRDRTEGEVTAANFQILCEWRGHSARTAMADFLVSSLRAVGKISFAEVITNVREKNRELQRSDFYETEKIKSK